MEIPRQPEARPTPENVGGCGPCPRLNLLLSMGGWQQDPWIDRLPKLLEPIGIHSLRAESGRQASEMIRQYKIHIAVVDLGLPLDQSGAEAGPQVLELIRRLDQPPPTVVVKRSRSHRDDCREMAAALRAGAFAVIDRPRQQSDLEMLLEVLRRCLHRHYQNRWPA
ncbi:MAG: hypothetical protein JNM80_14650 [Phycisphaerae bacterium]|nr:hypothetical protein [Phycisphaerae bacterium]